MSASGIGIGSGAALGVAIWMAAAQPEPADLASSRTPPEEAARAERALELTAVDLRARAALVDPVSADILFAQALMAEDPMVVDGVQERTRAGATAERAVFESFRDIETLLAALGGAQAARAVDFRDVSARVVAELTGDPVPGVPDVSTPFVLFAKDLAPADTADLDLSRVLGLVTLEGGPTSHTAILARARGIPSIVACGDAEQISEGDEVLVDAASGTVSLIGPDVSRHDAVAMVERRSTRRERSVGPGSLADGTPVPLLANVGSQDEAAQARELGAEGVGLLRTEFLYIGASTAPTTSEQEAEYASIFGVFPGCAVTARTLDSGADKPLSFLQMAPEENPALGVRGMRVNMSHLALLDQQLEALARASASSAARVRVMAPMVADAAEAAWFADRARAAGIESVGVMIEVPSCALMAREVLEVVDFASIGTNDLTQYTLAADRQHGGVAHYQDPWHPSVLRLIKIVGDASLATGKPVGVCGEAAADPMLAAVLVGLGMSTLSMTPVAIADVRETLRWCDREDTGILAEHALSADSAATARARVAAYVAERRGVRTLGSPTGEADQ